MFRTLLRSKASYPKQIDALLDVVSNLGLKESALKGASETKTHWCFDVCEPLKASNRRF